MTVDQKRLAIALGRTWDSAHPAISSDYVSVRTEDLRVLREAVSQTYGDEDRIVEIGERIIALEAAQRSFKRGFLTSEIGSLENALDHPMYVRAEAAIRRLEQELVILI